MKRIIIHILVIGLFILSLPGVNAVSTSNYDDGYVKIGETVIPLPEYMPGTFFTKNGQACTCHSIASIDCVASGKYCNCVRFVNIGGTDIDLLSVQCIGFARYCFYRLFGFTDTYQNTSLFYNAGTLPYGQVTAATVKSLISSVKPGTHIRFKLASSEHSVILLHQNDQGFTVYQCNSGGNGIPNASCVISTKTYTWESFATYAYRGILYANMPNQYPASVEYSDAPFDKEEYTVGVYELTANLRLRDGAGTEFEHIDTLPEGTVIEVTEVSGVWGKTLYNNKEGWVSLKFTAFIGLGTVIAPIANNGISFRDGYLYSRNYGITAAEFISLFHNKNLTADCEDESVIGTGSTVSIIEDGEILATAKVILIGDVNGDGWMTTADLAITKGHLSGSNQLDDVYSLAADVNENGVINTTDYKAGLYILSNNT